MEVIVGIRCMVFFFVGSIGLGVVVYIFNFYSNKVGIK